ncbi:hypothetical protein OE88DRAFT_1660578 [Heliocybe sulcata]|uniref:Uncharacterized protein n=1 Tax=Heliocybe sulcata TaxID=5364 RepID=A0A5C3MXP5_9AGAM|nr:hypothetical protein OE88DRAFT_1660578 [Heliocybe sulcata]
MVFNAPKSIFVPPERPRVFFPPENGAEDIRRRAIMHGRDLDGGRPPATGGVGHNPSDSRDRLLDGVKDGEQEARRGEVVRSVALGGTAFNNLPAEEQESIPSSPTLPLHLRIPMWARHLSRDHQEAVARGDLEFLNTFVERSWCPSYSDSEDDTDSSRSGSPCSEAMYVGNWDESMDLAQVEPRDGDSDDEERMPSLTSYMRVVWNMGDDTREHGSTVSSPERAMEERFEEDPIPSLTTYMRVLELTGTADDTD